MAKSTNKPIKNAPKFATIDATEYEPADLTEDELFALASSGFEEGISVGGEDLRVEDTNAVPVASKPLKATTTHITVPVSAEMSECFELLKHRQHEPASIVQAAIARFYRLTESEQEQDLKKVASV